MWDLIWKYVGSIVFILKLDILKENRLEVKDGEFVVL